MLLQRWPLQLLERAVSPRGRATPQPSEPASQRLAQTAEGDRGQPQAHLQTRPATAGRREDSQ